MFLVTGGSGLLGSRLVRKLLQDGHRVRVFDTRYGELSDVKTDPNLEFIGIGSSYQSGGMVDKRTVFRAAKNIDVVYHLAINWNGHRWTHRLPLQDLFDSNIRGTLNLLEAARSLKIKQFLFSSSAAVYGETKRTISLRRRGSLKEVFDEESTCRPYLWTGDPGPAYAILKLATENLCLMYYHRYRMPVTIFRVEYIFENREQLRDGANIHVEDVVGAFIQATLNKVSYGQVFDVAYPVQYLSTSKIRRLLNWKPELTRSLLS